MRRFVYTLIALCGLMGMHAFGQTQPSYSVSGMVLDSVTRQPLGFVTVIFNGNGSVGTTTNAFGKFTFMSDAPLQSITCNFIGYNNKTLSLNKSLHQQTVTVMLLPSQYKLQEVKVIAGENPANRIVRGVINHREQNDPDKLERFAYTAYNKFIYSGVPPVTNKHNDTTGLYRYLENHYFLILESVVETKYEKPDAKKEKVIGNKISGLQNPSFSLTSTQIQPLSFYGNFIEVLANKYINPFTKGSTERYFFNIEDTLYSGHDTIFKLSFRPWKGRNFDGLRGIAEVNTDGYALQHIVAEPADTASALMHIHIEQRNEKINGERWFPTRFVSDIRFSNMLQNGFRVMLHGVTTLSDVQLHPTITARDMEGVQVEMVPDAGDRDANFWTQHRSDSLSQREKETYAYLDSVGKSRHLDDKLRGVEALIDGEFRVKYVNFDIPRFLWVNDLEGFRPGVGLRTNERVFRNLSIGGFAGYGIKDQRWKYGGELKFRLYQRNDMFLDFNYWNDLEESGAVNFYKEQSLLSSDILRSYLVHSFDRVLRKEVDFTGRTFRYMHFDVGAFMAEKHSTTAYRFVKSVNGEPVETDLYNFTGVKLAFRYGYKEKIVNALHNSFFLTPDYPVIYFQVTHGFKGLLGGEFDYTKWEAKLEYSFSLKALGDVYLMFASGYVNKTLPLSDLFAGKGSYELVGLYAYNSFQTMRLNEFYSDRYVAGFYEHDLKSLLFRGRKFQPKPLVAVNAIVGTLGNKTVHRNVNFKTLEKGFVEGGLIVEDLLRKEYLGTVRIGVGLGGFYRLTYQYPHPLDNTAFKVDFTASF